MYKVLALFFAVLAVASGHVYPWGASMGYAVGHSVRAIPASVSRQSLDVVHRPAMATQVYAAAPVVPMPMMRAAPVMTAPVMAAPMLRAAPLAWKSPMYATNNWGMHGGLWAGRSNWGSYANHW